MGTRKGRRIAVVTVLAVIAIAGTLLWLSRDHIRFFLAFESLGSNAQGYPEFRHRQTGIVFVSLPGGTFMMGSPEDEEGRSDDEGPVHQVTLSPFMISKFEVTQAQWEAVMGANPSHFKGDDLPVETVSWDDCQEFCAKTGLSLPTEAQWEHACRANQRGPYSGTGRLDDMGWYDANSGGTLHPVATKRPNQFGVHDMHGNVWEWCEDEVSVSGSSGRGLRGGCYGQSAEICRSGYRFWSGPEARLSAVGFRPIARRP